MVGYLLPQEANSVPICWLNVSYICFHGFIWPSGGLSPVGMGSSLRQMENSFIMPYTVYVLPALRALALTENTLHANAKPITSAVFILTLLRTSTHRTNSWFISSHLAVNRDLWVLTAPNYCSFASNWQMTTAADI